jgi:hypothetical protein
MKKTRAYALNRNVLDITSLLLKKGMMKVSDTHKARGAGSPGHRAGLHRELNSSAGMVSGNGRCYDGDQFFQFLP